MSTIISPRPTREPETSIEESSALASDDARSRATSRQHGNAVIAIVLIGLGLTLLIDRAVGLAGGVLFLGLGASFAVARLASGQHAYGIPAGILLGFGAFVALDGARVLSGDQSGWLLVLLGLGFVASYVICARPEQIWPLFPAAALTALGVPRLGWLPSDVLAGYAWLAAWWPVMLVVAGVWLLVRDRLSAGWRLPLAVIAWALILIYALAAFAAIVASGTAVTSVAPWIRP